MVSFIWWVFSLSMKWQLKCYVAICHSCFSVTVTNLCEQTALYIFVYCKKSLLGIIKGKWGLSYFCLWQAAGERQEWDLMCCCWNMGTLEIFEVNSGDCSVCFIRNYQELFMNDVVEHHLKRGIWITVINIKDISLNLRWICSSKKNIVCYVKDQDSFHEPSYTMSRE